MIIDETLSMRRSLELVQWPITIAELFCSDLSKYEMNDRNLLEKFDKR